MSNPPGRPSAQSGGGPSHAPRGTSIHDGTDYWQDLPEAEANVSSGGGKWAAVFFMIGFLISVLGGDKVWPDGRNNFPPCFTRGIRVMETAFGDSYRT